MDRPVNNKSTHHDPLKADAPMSDACQDYNLTDSFT